MRGQFERKISCSAPVLLVRRGLVPHDQRGSGGQGSEDDTEENAKAVISGLFGEMK